MGKSSRETGAEVLASVMKMPRTAKSIMEMCDGAQGAIYAWLKQFHASGVFYIESWAEPASNGPPTRVYAMQSTPFEKPDAPRPTPKHKPRKRS